MINTEQKQISSRWLWILYCVLFLCTMYSERVLFSESFKELGDYLIIGGIWFAVFVVAVIVGNKLSIKSLTMIIFVGAIILAFIWLYFSFQLRIYSTTNYNCTTWDCEVKNEIFTYCNSWVCQTIGQSIQFAVQFGIILPCLFFLTHKRQVEVSNQISSSLGQMGLILILIAGIHYLAYYLAYYLIAMLWIGFALSLIPALKSSYNSIFIKKESKIQLSSSDSSKFRLDLWRMWSNLIILLFMALFGYSLLDGEDIHFELFFTFGIGVCFSAIIWYFMETEQNPLAHTIDRFETIVFLIIVASCVQGLLFFSLEPEVEFEVGMSPGIIGVIFGYIYIRIMAMLDLQYQPIGHSYLPLPRKWQGFFNLMILGLVFMILYVVGMIEIAPRVEAAYITYGAASIIGLLGLILSITRHHKNLPQS